MRSNCHDARLTVRYAETDQMGVAYYANYLVWMEVGRVEDCRAAGFRYRDLEAEDGVLLAVVEASCRYKSPAKYDDEVIVRTWIEKASSRMVHFGYEFLCAANGRRLAAGESKHIFCTRDLKPARLPARYLPLFGLTGRQRS